MATADQTFGWRLRQARRHLSIQEGRDITQADIAGVMGVTGVTVSRWESDAKQPDFETVARLAEVLGVSPGWLVFGEGGMLPEPRATPEPPGASRRVSSKDYEERRRRGAG